MRRRLERGDVSLAITVMVGEDREAEIAGDKLAKAS
jgi:hypothetical protein